MYKSEDEGFFFDKISDFPTMSNGAHAPISAFDVADANENVLLVAKRVIHQQNEKTKVFISQNAGASWSNVTLDLPDSLYATYISIDHEDPNTAWICFSGFADGKKIYKTTDAGLSWTNVSYNLPNIPVNTIVNQAGSKKKNT